MRRQRLQIFGMFLHPLGLGGEVLSLVHAHELRPEMQHERGFDIAAMDAEALFVLIDHAVRRTEAGPLGGNDGHLISDAQFACDNTHDVEIAAMRVDDHHLAQAGLGNLRADRRPDRDQKLRAERQRAGAINVFIGLADLLQRQHEEIEIVGALDLQFCQHALSDRDIGCDRQVRAMLLGRGDRQDRDGGIG